MFNTLLSLGINIEDNRQLGPIVIAIAAVVIVGMIIVGMVLNAKDKRKAKSNEEIDVERQAERVVQGVAGRSQKPVKKINQIKRESRDPNKMAENEAAAKNTLLGGKSEAQMEEKEASQVFGSLGISSKKAEEIDKAKEQIIINGYLQKSNTAPIRPVYSNTLEARQQQKRELDSDTVGKEAETPALVMDSSAPSEVKITEAPQKVKPTSLKRPTAARLSQSDEELIASMEAAAEAAEADRERAYGSAIRPVVGSEVSNAVVERVAEVQAEKPDILKQGEEAILPAAEKPLAGFAPNPDLVAGAENAER